MNISINKNQGIMQTFSTTFTQHADHEEVQIFKSRSTDSYYCFSIFESPSSGIAQHVQFRATKEEVQELIEMLQIAINK